MSARAALPVLLLSLLALPAHADIAYPPDPCERMEEGAVCGQDATCRHLTCGKDNDDDGILEYEWDCRLCMTQQQFETFKRYEQVYAENASRTLEGRLLHWGPWALGASCLITLVWYQLRRRPSGSEPPSPPTA
ncbi:hypothetical protein NR798_46830 [Archangium gephyra]|uniref:hypothetical protein n=1 Tax=Archangium gephyra TaxID=48 RepID=UPI0035D4D596